MAGSPSFTSRAVAYYPSGYDHLDGDESSRRRRELRPQTQLPKEGRRGAGAYRTEERDVSPHPRDAEPIYSRTSPRRDTAQRSARRGRSSSRSASPAFQEWRSYAHLERQKSDLQEEGLSKRDREARNLTVHIRQSRSRSRSRSRTRSGSRQRIQTRSRSRSRSPRTPRRDTPRRQDFLSSDLPYQSPRGGEVRGLLSTPIRAVVRERTREQSRMLLDSRTADRSGPRGRSNKSPRNRTAKATREPLDNRGEKRLKADDQINVRSLLKGELSAPRRGAHTHPSSLPSKAQPLSPRPSTIANAISKPLESPRGAQQSALHHTGTTRPIEVPSKVLQGSPATTPTKARQRPSSPKTSVISLLKEYSDTVKHKGDSRRYSTSSAARNDTFDEYRQNVETVTAQEFSDKKFTASHARSPPKSFQRSTRERPASYDKSEITEQDSIDYERRVQTSEYDPSLTISRDEPLQKVWNVSLLRSSKFICDCEGVFWKSEVDPALVPELPKTLIFNELPKLEDHVAWLDAAEGQRTFYAISPKSTRLDKHNFRDTATYLTKVKQPARAGFGKTDQLYYYIIPKSKVWEQAGIRNVTDSDIFLVCLMPRKAPTRR